MIRRVIVLGVYELENGWLVVRDSSKSYANAAAVPFSGCLLETLRSVACAGRVGKAVTVYVECDFKT